MTHSRGQRSDRQWQEQLLPAAQGSVDPESGVGAEAAQGSALGGVTAGGDTRRGQGSEDTTNKEEKPG